VYFPGGEELLWFSAQLDGTFYPGTGLTDVPVTIDRIPVFYRRGSIIVTKQTSRPSTTDMKDDYYTLFAFLKNDSTATGTVYLDDNLSFEYRDSMRYNYVSLVSYGNIIVYSSIDDSDSQGFDLKIEEVITVIPETSYDGSLTGRCLKTSYKYTADGIPLNQIKLKGKETASIKLY
jgi:alpha 1,3-glucosidase